MYAYNRFWVAKKSMLLYPGKINEKKEGEYQDILDGVKHYCSIGFVNVLDKDNELNNGIAKEVLDLLDL
jgi:5-methylcytosine-specific restriction enzyme subunit McrC